MAEAPSSTQLPLVTTVPPNAAEAGPCQSETRPGIDRRSAPAPCRPPATPVNVVAASRLASGWPSGTVMPAKDSPISACRDRVLIHREVGDRGAVEVRGDAADRVGGHGEGRLPALDGPVH